MDRIRMSCSRDKIGIGMPVRGGRAEEEDKGHKHGQVTTSRRVEGPQSRIPEQQQTASVFSGNRGFDQNPTDSRKRGTGSLFSYSQ